MFFAFFVFLYIIIYILDIAGATKKMSFNEIRDFVIENYYKENGFSNQNSYYLMKHLRKKIVVACK